MRDAGRARPLTFGSLFSGCGGLDLGFRDAGFIGLGGVDINENACKVYEANFSCPIQRHDLGSATLPASFPQRVDVLVAGSPCQGFSTAGNRLFSDPRNNLLLAAGRIAITLKPRVFVAENVAGLLAGKHKKYWDDLEQMIRSAGYRVEMLICQANQLGVPQIRTRVFMLAWRENVDWTVTLPEIPGGNLRSALKNVDGCKNHEPEFLDPKWSARPFMYQFH